MKLRSILFIATLHITSFNLTGQQYNPFVTMGNISPQPLLPLEFGGRGVISFIVGNSGSSDLYLEADREMGLVIGLSRGVPDNVDPIKAIKGEWANYFSWTYIPTSNSLVGTQIKEIKAMTSGTITVDYRVTGNSRSSTKSNGFNMNLQPPPYANGDNSTSDDSTDEYTFTKADDFGDAPLSYGMASAEIDLFKSNGNYTNFVMLGDTVDHDLSFNYSNLADGDDLSGLDDEDGVTFPNKFVQGVTVTIPVATTIRGGSSNFINAWIDWNGDGIFDENERITGNGVFVSTIGSAKKVTNLTVAVPAGAKAGRTYARFRFGENRKVPDGAASYGEVEDYVVEIFASSPSIALEKKGVSNDINNNGRADVGEKITYTFRAQNFGNSPLTNVEVVDSMISNTRFSVSPSTLNPGEVGLATAQYTLKQSDISNGYVYNKAYAFGDPSGQSEISAQSVDPNPLKVGDVGYSAVCPTCTYTKISQGGRISGIVWEDLNFNGIYDANEILFQGQKVILYNNENIRVDSTFSRFDGAFSFNYLENGSYYLKFILNSGFAFTSAQISNELGSKVNEVNGRGTTASYNLAGELAVNSINAGLILGALPVSWENVEVRRDLEMNLVSWTVSSEIDVEKYEIYRSTDEGIRFDLIGEVKSEISKERSLNEYSFLDKNANSDNNYYYYVENVDKDRQRSRSKIVSIAVLNNIKLDVYPNPASNLINISLPLGFNEQVDIKLYDGHGKLVKVFSSKTRSNKASPLKLDIGDIAPGGYVLSMKVGEKEFYKKIIIVQ